MLLLVGRPLYDGMTTPVCALRFRSEAMYPTKSRVKLSRSARAADACTPLALLLLLLLLLVVVVLLLLL